MNDRILQPTKDIILLLHSKMNFTVKKLGEIPLKVGRQSSKILHIISHYFKPPRKTKNRLR